MYLNRCAVGFTASAMPKENPMSDWRLFSKPWTERPWWSKAKDAVSIGLTGAVLLIVIWDAVGRRWLGH